MTIKVEIIGLSCKKCMKRIEDSLLEIDGIASIEFMDSLTIIEMTKEISFKVIKDKIESLGTYWVEMRDEE